VRLDLVVGPNGAGKSTFVELLLADARPGVAFVNADEIARARWPDDPAVHSYDAARVAERTRARLIAKGMPLIAETVFSHPSKLELIDTARAAGYTVALQVLLVPENVAVERVRSRVAAGGHSVPEGKIRGRFQRVWPLVADAVRRSNSARIWDNSRTDGPAEIALFADGVALGPCRWPDWTPAVLPARLGH
jgi:predicted ABC-type ATPase